IVQEEACGCGSGASIGIGGSANCESARRGIADCARGRWTESADIAESCARRPRSVRYDARKSYQAASIDRFFVRRVRSALAKPHAELHVKRLFHHKDTKTHANEGYLGTDT